ncbi:MAG: OsmC family protein [Promethearchaeota archaeon]
MNFGQIKKTYKQNPNVGIIPYQIKLVKTGILQVKATAGKHEIKIDEPKGIGGTDEYANPIQIFLASLGSCILNSITLNSKFLNIKFNSIKITVGGQLDYRGILGLDENSPKGFKEINIKIKIDSDESAKNVKKLIDFATATCPIHSTIVNPTKIITKIIS